MGKTLRVTVLATVDDFSSLKAFMEDNVTSIERSYYGGIVHNFYQCYHDGSINYLADLNINSAGFSMDMSHLTTSTVWANYLAILVQAGLNNCRLINKQGQEFSMKISGSRLIFSKIEEVEEEPEEDPPFTLEDGEDGEIKVYVDGDDDGTLIDQDDITIMVESLEDPIQKGEKKETASKKWLIPLLILCILAFATFVIVKLKRK